MLDFHTIEIWNFHTIEIWNFQISIFDNPFF